MRYVYECFQCGHTIEKDVRLADYEKAVPCTKCSGAHESGINYMTRVVQPVRFKVKVGRCGNANTGYSGNLVDHPDYSPNRGFNQDNLED